MPLTTHHNGGLVLCDIDQSSHLAAAARVAVHVPHPQAADAVLLAACLCCKGKQMAGKAGSDEDGRHAGKGSLQLPFPTKQTRPLKRWLCYALCGVSGSWSQGSFCSTSCTVRFDSAPSAPFAKTSIRPLPGWPQAECCSTFSRAHLDGLHGCTLPPGTPPSLTHPGAPQTTRAS